MRSAVGEAAAAEASRRLPRLLLGPVRAEASDGLESDLAALAAVVADLRGELRAQRDLLMRIAREEGRSASWISEAVPVWLVVPTAAGYVVSEYEPTAPVSRGSIVSLADVDYRVAVIGRSLFPDGRTCLYLEPPQQLGTTANGRPASVDVDVPPAPRTIGTGVEGPPAATTPPRPLGR